MVAKHDHIFIRNSHNSIYHKIHYHAYNVLLRVEFLRFTGNWQLECSCLNFGVRIECLWTRLDGIKEYVKGFGQSSECAQAWT